MGVLETGWGLDIILWFQSWRTPLVTSLAMVFHYLGITEFYILVLPFVYWSLDEKLGRRLGVLIALTAWVVGWAKSLFGRPRPYFISSDVSNMVEETSYGLPSGHAQGATSLAGFAAWHARRAWVTVAAVLYILLMAASRMVLGVHYPQDVASGILIALVLLALYAWLEPRIADWLAGLSLGSHLALIVGITALMIIIHPVLFEATSPQWLSPPVPPQDLIESALSTSALFFGMTLGFALDWHYQRFSAGGDWTKRLLRFLIGFVGVGVLEFGLGAVLPENAVFAFVSYALIGLWVGVGAPWLFVVTRLASAQINATRQPA